MDKGKWQLLLNNTGVVAMHMALTHLNTVIMFDQAGVGQSGYRLRHRFNGTSLVSSKTGLVMHILSTMGHFYKVVDMASRRIRYFRPCENGHYNWKQLKWLLSDARWYASNQILPAANDRVILRQVFSLSFLQRTYERNASGNNLYPFTFSRMAIWYGSRNCPSSGSSVLLCLDHSNNFRKVKVMVCGGAAAGAYRVAAQGRFLKGLSSCGTMVLTRNKHVWKMEHMPEPRLLNNMLILPTGHILIINGAKRGSAGWNNAASLSFRPYLYKPRKTLGKVFINATLIVGGNPNYRYTFSNVAYPTELRLQGLVLHYMDRRHHNLRPLNVSINCYSSLNSGVKYGGEFSVDFWLERRSSNYVEFTAYEPPFTTHSVSMNQRMFRPRCEGSK
ncbi:hypothetical protein KPL70_006117 [Citrus sinensis]|nr:hypothetical protein KPL70_006117 [Citrus sinensis]